MFQGQSFYLVICRTKQACNLKKLEVGALAKVGSKSTVQVNFSLVLDILLKNYIYVTLHSCSKQMHTVTQPVNN